MRKFRKRMAVVSWVVIIGLLSSSYSIGQQLLPPVHDPCIIKQDSTYYIFSTGFGISEMTSRNLKDWKRNKSVFSQSPSWITKALPKFNNVMWAPDISYYNGLYYLFYAASAFEKNTSCIGLATNRTLDQRSAAYQWKDQGRIVESIPGRDLWNAIDPNLAVDENKEPWLAFGSFWEGIKLVQLTTDRLQLKQPQKWYTIARRARSANIADSLPGDAAIEAPFLFRHGDYFYLFVSFDYCCRALKSNYKIMVGRSKQIYGPYVDQKGVPMTQGGGSLILGAEKRWPGQGHNAVLSDNGNDYLVFHAYDGEDKGRSKLRILPIRWDREGWPNVEQQ